MDEFLVTVHPHGIGYGNSHIAISKASRKKLPISLFIGVSPNPVLQATAFGVA